MSRSRPQAWVVHSLVRQHFVAFAARVQEGDLALQRDVVVEFEDFLRCGVLACGFMRSRCAGCGHDRLVADGVFACREDGSTPTFVTTATGSSGCAGTWRARRWRAVG